MELEKVGKSKRKELLDSAKQKDSLEQIKEYKHEDRYPWYVGRTNCG